MGHIQYYMKYKNMPKNFQRGANSGEIMLHFFDFQNKTMHYGWHGWVVDSTPWNGTHSILPTIQTFTHGLQGRCKFRYTILTVVLKFISRPILIFYYVHRWEKANVKYIFLFVCLACIPVCLIRSNHNRFFNLFWCIKWKKKRVNFPHCKIYTNFTHIQIY